MSVTAVSSILNKSSACLYGSAYGGKVCAKLGVLPGMSCRMEAGVQVNLMHCTVYVTVV